MTLIGGILIGLAVGLSVGMYLMRQYIKVALENSVSVPTWVEVSAAFDRGDV